MNSIDYSSIERLVISKSFDVDFILHDYSYCKYPDNSDSGLGLILLIPVTEGMLYVI